MRVSWIRDVSSGIGADKSTVIDYKKAKPTNAIAHKSVDVMIDTPGAVFSSVLTLPRVFILRH